MRLLLPQKCGTYPATCGIAMTKKISVGTRKSLLHVSVIANHPVSSGWRGNL